MTTGTVAGRAYTQLLLAGLLAAAAPGLQLAGQDRVFLVGDAATFAIDTLTLSGDADTLRASEEVWIRIPAGLDLTWDPTRPPTAGDAGALRFASGRELVLTLAQDLGPGETARISGLAVVAPILSAEPQAVTVSRGRGGAAEAAAFAWGVDELTVASDPVAYLVGDPAAALPDVVVSNRVGGGLRAGRLLSLTLPDGLPATWVADPAGVRVEGKLGPPAFGGRAAVFPVTADFADSDRVVISGLQLQGFETPLANTRLSLSADGAVRATTGGAVRIGRLRLDVADQAFLAGDSETGLGTVTITDTLSGLTAGKALRLRLPAGFAGRWAPSAPVTTAPSGVLTGVVIEADEVRFTVAAAPAAPIRVDGLRLADFAGSSAPGPVTVSANPQGAANATSTGQLQVGELSVGLRDRAFLVGDGADSLGTVTISESAVAAGLVRGRVLRLRLPDGFPGSWVPARPIAVGGAQRTKVGAANLVGDAIELAVTDAFAPGESFTLDGIQVQGFTQAFAAAPLLLAAAEGVTSARSDGQVRVGQLSFGFASLALLAGDPRTGLGQMTVTESAIAAGLTAGRRLRLVLPSAFPGTWAPASAITPGGIAGGKVAAAVTADDRIVEIRVTGDFGRGEVLTIDGLALDLPADAPPAAPAPVSLVSAAGAVNATSSGTLRVGRLTLQMADRALVHGNPPTALGAVRISEDPVAAGLTASRTLRLRLPEGFTATWDPVGSIRVSGDGVDTQVAYVGDEARIRMTADLAPGASFLVESLALRAFTGPVAPAPLELTTLDPRHVVPATAAVAVADGRLRIGRPSLQLARGASYLVHDVDTPLLPTLTLAESATAAGLVAGDTVRIVIPAEAGVHFAEVDRVQTSGPLDTVVTYSADGKAARIAVLADLEAASTIEIAGLRVTGFDFASAPLPLHLQANGEGQTNAQTDSALGVGVARLRSARNHSFVVGDGASGLDTLYLSEDPDTPVLTSQRSVRLSLPATGLLWDQARAGEVVATTDRGVGALGPAAVEPGDSVLSLPVLQGFSPGARVAIVGLPVRVAGVVARDTLRLSLNGGLSENGRDEGWLQVGAPTVTSAQVGVYDLDEGSFALTVAIQEDGTAASITPETGLRLSWPEGSGLTWSTAPGAVSTSVSGLARGRVGPVATVTPDLRSLDLAVTTPFEPGEELVVATRAALVGVTPPSRLSLTVTQPGVDAQDPNPVRVGDPTIGFDPAATAVRDTVYARGDTSRSLPRLLIAESPIAAILNARDDLLISLPPSFRGAFRPEAASSIAMDVVGQGRVQPATAASFEDGDRTLRLDIATDFAAGDTLRIGGIPVFPGDGASPRDSVRVSALQGRHGDRAFAIRTGSPQLRSAADQSFVVRTGITGDSLESAQPITVVESDTAAAIVAGEPVRIQIPPGLSLSWDRVGEGWDRDAAGSPLILAGPAAPKVDRVDISHPDTLRITVGQDFAPGDSLILGGLAFRGFTGVSPAARLRLSVTGGASVSDEDERTKRIGRPTLRSARPQRFIAGFPLGGIVDAAPIAIREDEVSGSIDSLVTLRIPAALGLSWFVASSPIERRGLATVVRITDSEAVFAVSQPLAAGDSLVIERLRVNVGSTPTPAASLALSVNGGTDAVDAVTKRVAGPPAVALDGQDLVFAVLDPDTTLRIRIRDHVDEPSLIAADTVLIALPDSVAATWRELTDADLQPGGVATVASVSRRRLRIALSRDLAAGDSLVVAARLGDFQDVSRRVPILFSATGDTTLHVARTPEGLRIGRPTLRSAADQVFIAGRDALPGRSFVAGGDTVDRPLAEPFVIREHPDVAAITAARDIRVVIPSGLAMRWVDSDPELTGAAAKVDSLSLNAGRDTLVIHVGTDFAPGDSLAVTGMGLGGFATASRRDSLALSVNGGLTANARDLATKRVGAPTVSVGMGRRYLTGEGEVSLPLAIAEDPVESAITPAGGLRLTLADLGEGNLVWAEPTGAVASGATDKVDLESARVLAGKTLRIPVRQPFAPGDSLRLTGLRVRGLVAVGRADTMLSLLVSGDDDVDGRTPHAVRIGDLGMDADSNQTFWVHEWPETAARITVAERGGIPILDPGDTLRVRLTPGLQMRWLTPTDSAVVTLPETGVQSVSGRDLLEAVATVLPPGGADAPQVVDSTTVAFVLRSDYRDSLGVATLRLDSLLAGGFRAASRGSLSLDVGLAGDDGRRADGLPRFARLDTHRIAVTQPWLASGLETFLVGDASTATGPYVLTDDADAEGLAVGTRVHLYLPPDLAAAWDPAATLNDSTRIRRLSVGPDSSEAVFEVLVSPFGTDPLALAGLALTDFARVSADARIQVGLERPGAAKPVAVAFVDDDPKRIGRVTFTVRDTIPREGGLQDQMVFVSQAAVLRNAQRRDPTSAPIYRVTVQEDAGAAVLLQGDTLALELPAGFPAAWDLGVDSIRADRLVALPGASDTLAYRFRVAGDFAAGEATAVDGLRLRSTGGSAPDTSLALRVRRTYSTRSPQTLRIGSPAISSDTTQVLSPLETAAVTVSIAEDDTAAAIVAERDIHLVIPAGLDVRWDTTATDTTGRLSGNAVGRIGSPFVYPAADVATIPVKTDFEPGDSLTVRLRVVARARSSAGALQAWVFDASQAAEFAITDPESLYVGAPTLMSVADQVFVQGLDPAGTVYPLYPLYLIEDPRVTTIRAGSLIRLVLPDSLSWAAGSGSTVDIEVRGETRDADALVEHRATIQGDTAIVRIRQTFGLGDTLAIVSGLQVRVASRMAPDSLGLSVTTSGGVHSYDLRRKWIGKPELTIDGPATYAVDATAILGDRRTGLEPPDPRRVAIRDTADPTLRAGRRLRVHLPESLRRLVRWREAGLTGVTGGLTDSLRLLEDGHVLQLAAAADGGTIELPLALEVVPRAEADYVDTLVSRLFATGPEGDGGPLTLTADLSAGTASVLGIAIDLDYGAALNRTRLDTSAQTVSAYLPVLFDEPEIVTVDDGGGPATALRFLTWPGRIDSGAVTSESLPILGLGVEGGDAVLTGSPGRPISVSPARASYWGPSGLARVSYTLEPDEVRRLNRWYDDAGDVDIAIELAVADSLLPDLAFDLDEAGRDTVRTPGAQPADVTFPLAARHTRGGDGGARTVELSRSLPEGTAVRFAVLDGVDRTDVTTVRATEVAIADASLAEGLHEVWIYGAVGDTTAVAGLPTVREFVIDRTPPVIYQEIDPTPGFADSVAAPQPLAASGDASRNVHTLRPFVMRGPRDRDGQPAADHLLPVWNRETLHVRYRDNIEVSGVSGVDMRVRSGDEEGRALAFRGEELPHPLQLELWARSADGQIVPLAGVAADALAAQLAHPGRSAAGTVADSALHLDLGIEVRSDTVNAFALPLAALPPAMTAEGVVLGLRLRISDRAGNSTTLEVRDEEFIRLLLASSETHGALLNKLMNFPNPFRTVAAGANAQDVGTTIRFVLTEPAAVRLRVFDVTGEQLYVAELADLSGGEQLHTWPGRDLYGQPLATGIYLALLEVTPLGDSRADVQRAVLAVNNR